MHRLYIYGFICSLFCHSAINVNDALLKKRVLLRAVPRVWNWNGNTSTDELILADIRGRIIASGKRPLILGVSFISHDMSLAAIWGNEVIGVIELERLYKIRYFDLLDAMNSFMPGMPDEARLNAAIERWVVPALIQLCNLAPRELSLLSSANECQLQYDVGVFALTAPSDERANLQKGLMQVVRATSWVTVDHHHAHAALGWLDSPFYHSQDSKYSAVIVLSYDGHGNDGTLRTFLGTPGVASLKPLGNAKWECSFGLAYMFAASIVRDLAWGSPYGASPPCAYLPPWRYTGRGLALPGAFMAFAAIGKPRKEWHAGAKLLLTRGLWENELWPSPFGGLCMLLNALNERGTVEQCCSESSGIPYCTTAPYFACRGADEPASQQLDRDFAATVQHMLQIAVVAEVRRRLIHSDRVTPSALVISGGCALNVKANSALARELGLPAHVPSAPGDSGLSLGAAWLAMPPMPGQPIKGVHFSGTQLMYGGTALAAEQLEQIAVQWGAVTLNGVQHLAELLLDGAIVGVARGRSEFGPRALGHRSLLAAAHRVEQKDRLNRLKRRRWYRPCAPIVVAEDLEHLFEPGPDLAFGTPHMSFAPPLQAWVVAQFPALTHIDNTARPQSVRKDDDPWMHSLLLAMRSAMKKPSCSEFGTSFQNSNRSRHEGCSVGVLINTSLNPQGKPIITEAFDAIKMFCGLGSDDLDFVLLEERWLFQRDIARSLGLCSGEGVQDSATFASENFLLDLPQI